MELTEAVQQPHNLAHEISKMPGFIDKSTAGHLQLPDITKDLMELQNSIK